MNKSMARAKSKYQCILLAAGLAGALTAWHWQGAGNFAWATEGQAKANKASKPETKQEKKQEYIPSDTTLEQNVKGEHTVTMPPLAGEVNVDRVQVKPEGNAPGSLFPDAALKIQTAPIEAPPVTVKITGRENEADPNTGEKARGAAARGHRYLANGSTLLVPDTENIIETPFGELHVEQGSVALIVCKSSALAIYDLHDGSKNAITIHYHEAKPIELLPGRAVIIANGSESAFEEVNPAPWVEYRKLSMTNKELPNLNVFRAEFDMLHMIGGFPQLKALIKSPDPARKKAMANLLKTAVIMGQVGGRMEPYQHYLSRDIRRQLELERQKPQ